MLPVAVAADRRRPSRPLVAATRGPTAAGSTTPGVEERTDADTVTRDDPPWDVIVWDDPVNLMAYVVHVFRKVLGVDEAVARKLMYEVHNDGRSLVASEPRETAERYVRELHAHGLHATMRHDA